ncbi:hypothetical protein [Sulfitobacter sp. EhC04]|uniref:hypothetical protein n=1 Tax=Sulfitobacter sp. EhC04 TaxID=1849168 RepID=UPI001372563B|nr:hypothetical protein [Sulfitobacter sp. EhC04]
MSVIPFPSQWADTPCTAATLRTRSNRSTTPMTGELAAASGSPGGCSLSVAA